MLCPTRWRKFGAGCYFVSTAKKNWTESRRACVAEGADLVVVDGGEEQEFINGLLDVGQNAWMGLTDGLKEGEWTWVDGTPATTTGSHDAQALLLPRPPTRVTPAAPGNRRRTTDTFGCQNADNGLCSSRLHVT
ncbi:CD209 antigen-like protein E isoform X1 [Embiotoca jacksoni]|uniref:CD209 antigen-like protein E isoform X1 n=1 Tax=Embiotoca jacksoni TaxID=100190 RepID=UPI003703CB98